MGDSSFYDSQTYGVRIIYEVGNASDKHIGGVTGGTIAVILGLT